MRAGREECKKDPLSTPREAFKEPYLSQKTRRRPLPRIGKRWSSWSMALGRRFSRLLASRDATQVGTLPPLRIPLRQAQVFRHLPHRPLRVIGPALDAVPTRVHQPRLPHALAVRGWCRAGTGHESSNGRAAKIFLAVITLHHSSSVRQCEAVIGNTRGGPLRNRGRTRRLRCPVGKFGLNQRKAWRRMGTMARGRTGRLRCDRTGGRLGRARGKAGGRIRTMDRGRSRRRWPRGTDARVPGWETRFGDGAKVGGAACQKRAQDLRRRNRKALRQDRGDPLANGLCAATP